MSHCLRRSLVVPIAISTLAGFAVAADPDEVDGLRISKETTRITEPRDDDGYVDYVEAINRLQSQGVTPENNYEVGFRRAFGYGEIRDEYRAEYFRRMGIPVPAENGMGYASHYEYVGFSDLNQADRIAFEETASAVMEGPWKAADQPRAAAWLKSIEGPLDALVEATRRPRHYTPYVTGRDEDDAAPRMIAVLLPSAQEQRDVARSLLARSMLRLGEGDVDGAWSDLQAIHRQARHVAGGVTLIEGLVGVALERIACVAEVRVLAIGKPNAAQLARMQGDLEKLGPLPAMVDSLNTGERFMGLDAVQTFSRKGITEMGRLNGAVNGRGEGSWERVGASLLKLFVFKDGSPIDWNTTMIVMNGRYDAIVEAASVADPAKRDARFNDMEAELQKIAAEARSPGRIAQLLLFGGREGMGEMMANVLSAMLMPSVRVVFTAEDSALAGRDVTRVAIALERYRHEHDEYPAKLQALAPDFLTAIPKDANTGRDLVYKPNENGFLLYGLGRNRTDDGGRHHDDAHPNADDLVIEIDRP